jgi:hypothetical protein
MNTKMIQTKFKTPIGQAALAYHVPMDLLQETKKAYKEEGLKVRIVYRGSRRLMGLSKEYASFTYKGDATSFSVYKV